MRRLLFLILLINLPVTAGLFPVITSIKTVNVDGYEYHYYITTSLMELGPSVDVPPLNERYVYLTHKHITGGGTNPQIGTPSATLNVEPGMTMSEAAVTLYNTKGKDIPYIVHTSSAYGVLVQGECVAYIFANGSGSPWASVQTPGGCLTTPPSDEWCKITTPQLEFNHGTISLKNAEGATKSASMGVNCTTPMSVTFNLMTDQPYVLLEPAGQAEITVGDLPLKSKIDLPAGDTTLTVKDMLSGVNTEGVTSGSSVLVMEPY